VLLLVRPEYRLTPGFDGIQVKALVSLHPKAGALADARRPLGTLPGVVYFNEFIITVGMPDWPASAPKELKDAAELWVADKGAKGRALIDAAMAELAQMIAWDLGQGGSLENRYSAPVGAREVMIHWEGVGKLSAPVVHEGNGRVWARHSWGPLYSMKQ
jgi:hypothetical protein